MKGLSDKQRATLRRAARAWRAGGQHVRAVSAGERVTLASLFDRGLLARRAWRGDGVSRDSAFEYRPSDELLEALARHRETARLASLIDAAGDVDSP